MNFRSSDCVAACVDYVESVDSVVCVKNTLFLTLEQVLVELRVLVCIDLHLC